MLKKPDVAPPRTCRLAETPDGSTVAELTVLSLPETEKVAPVKYNPWTATVTVCPLATPSGKTELTVGAGITVKVEP
jgi:hypothetical protein